MRNIPVIVYLLEHTTDRVSLIAVARQLKIADPYMKRNVSLSKKVLSERLIYVERFPALIHGGI